MARDNQQKRSVIGRRMILACGAAGLVGGGYGMYRIEHRGAHRKLHPDGRYRRITLAWPNPDQDPVLVIARQKGIFAGYNLDITLLDSIVTGNDAITALKEGRAVAAVAPALSWIPRLRDDGVDARLLCGVRPGSFRLLTRKAASITRVESLGGRTIGVVREDTADRLFFSVLLRRKGLDPENGVKWKTVAVDDVSTAMQHGEIDAIAVHDPLAWRLMHQPGFEVVELLNSIAGHYGERVNLVLGATNAFLSDDPDAAQTLALALRDAAKWTRENLDEVAVILADETSEITDDAILDMLQHEAVVMSPISRELRVQMAQYVDELKLLGMIPDEVDSAGYARQICASLKSG